MIDYKEKVESALKDLAIEFTPPGSEPKATIHQWIHALHSNSGLFAKKRGAEHKVIIRALEKANLLTPSGKLKKQIIETFKLKPGKSVDFRFIDLFAGIGGMRLGFESAGGVCVFSSEFEKMRRQPMRKIMVRCHLVI